MRGGRRSDTTDNRNRRMFASMQSALGATATPLREKTRPNRQQREPPPQELTDVQDIITQIAQLSSFSNLSAREIKRNIEASGACLDEMWDEEWTALCDALTQCALDKNEMDFVVDLIPLFMKYDLFVDTMQTRLTVMSARHVMEEIEDGDPLYHMPYLLGTLLCCHWPREYSRATVESNPLLFTAYSILKGWMDILDEEGNPPPPPTDPVDGLADEVGKLETPSTQDSDKVEEGQVTHTEKTEDGDDDDDERSEDEESTEKQKTLLLNRCAVGLCRMSNSQQRSLWMKHPTLCDELYMSAKQCLINSNRLSPETRSRLLQTVIAMHDWTRPKAVTSVCVSTQTVPS